MVLGDEGQCLCFQHHRIDRLDLRIAGVTPLDPKTTAPGAAVLKRTNNLKIDEKKIEKRNASDYRGERSRPRHALRNAVVRAGSIYFSAEKREANHCSERSGDRSRAERGRC